MTDQGYFIAITYVVHVNDLVITALGVLVLSRHDKLVAGLDGELYCRKNA